ncbi:MAG: DUF3795 domain-containing protein [Candidatus Hadarchaeia archaeon]
MNLGCCGDECSSCPRFIATKEGSNIGLEEIAKLWKKIGWRDEVENPRDMECRGCDFVDQCPYGIKECTVEKGVENCGECGCYPCERLEKVFEKVETYRRKCREICSENEYQLIEKAFLSKKENLDKINELL